MTARPARSALLGAMLAILAVLGMVALSTWHSAGIDDRDPVHLVSIDHIHDGAADPDGAIHVAAHTAGHGLEVPSAAMPVARPKLRTAGWPVHAAAVLPSLDPGAILRPPRA